MSVAVLLGVLSLGVASDVGTGVAGAADMAAGAAPGGVAPAPPAISVEAPGALVTGSYSELPLTLSNPTQAAGGSEESLEVLLIVATQNAPLSPGTFSLQEEQPDGSYSDVTTLQGNANTATPDPTSVTAAFDVSLPAGQTMSLHLREKIDGTSTATTQYIDGALFGLDSSGKTSRLFAEDRHNASVGGSGVAVVGLDGRQVIDPGSIPKRGDLGITNGGPAEGTTTVGLTISAAGQQLVPADYDFERVVSSAQGAVTMQPVTFTSDGRGGLTATLETVNLAAGYTERTPYVLGVAAGAPSSALLTTSLTPAGSPTALVGAQQYTGSFGILATQTQPAQISAGGPAVTSVVTLTPPPTDDYADLRLRVDVTPPAGTRTDQLSLSLTEPDGSQTSLPVVALGGGVFRGETETAWTAPLPARTLRQLPLSIGLAADAPPGQLSVASALVQQPSEVEVTRTSAVTTQVFARPSAPAAPVLTASPGGLLVSGMPPVSDGGSAITGYLVTAVQGSTRVVTAATTSAQLTGLRDDQPVYVTLAAVNAVGVGPASTASVATPGMLPSSLTSRGSSGSVTAGGYLTVSGRLVRTVDGAARAGRTITINEVRRDGRRGPLGSTVTGPDGSWTFRFRPDGDALVTASGLGVTAAPVRVTVGAGIRRLVHRRQATGRLLVSAVVTTASGRTPIFDVISVRGTKVLGVLASVKGKRLQSKGFPTYSVRVLLRQPGRAVRVAFRVRATDLTDAVTSRVTAV